MALSIVQLESGYYPFTDKGQPIAGGSLYVGVEGKDPEVAGNQIAVKALQQDGTTVSIAQPISLSPGGVPSLNGSNVVLVADGDYAIKVLDKKGSQAYYHPRRALGAPLDITESVRVFDTLDIAKAQAYELGQLVQTIENTTGNGGGAQYVVSILSSPDGYRDHATTGGNLQLTMQGEADIYQLGGLHGGIYNNTDVIESVNMPTFVPNGTFLCDDDVILELLYGPGLIKKSFGDISLTQSYNPSTLNTLSEATLLGINPMEIVVDGSYAYAVNQGSYNATQQGYFYIADVRDPYKSRIISTLAIGAIGDLPRAMSVKGDYAYAMSFGGTCYIVNISDKSNPILASTVILNSGNREHCKVYGETLIIPKMTTNEVDFYSLSDPLNPLLVKTLLISGANVFHQPIIDGNLIWIPNYNDGLSDNLLCVDMSDASNPVELSFTNIPSLTFSRRGKIVGSYLFMGGFAASSRWNVIDISNPLAPVAVYTDPLEPGSFIEVADGVAYVGSSATGAEHTKIYDLSSPIDPVLVNTFADGTLLERLIIKGNYAIGFGEGTGAQGPASNDGKEDPTIRISRVSNNKEKGTIQAERIFSDQLTVDNQIKAGAMIAGTGGVSSSGPMSGRRLFSQGGIDNTNKSSELAVVLEGDSTINKDVFSVGVKNSHIYFELRYTLIYDSSQSFGATHTAGIKNFTYKIAGDGVAYVSIPAGDMVDERINGAPSTIDITIANGTADDPVKIGVSSPELDIANSRIILFIKASCSVDNLDMRVL